MPVVRVQLQRELEEQPEAGPHPLQVEVEEIVPAREDQPEVEVEEHMEQPTFLPYSSDQGAVEVEEASAAQQWERREELGAALSTWLRKP